MVNSPSESSTLIGNEVSQNTAPETETISKAEIEALFRNLRSLEKEIKNLKAARTETAPKAEKDSEKDEMKKQITLLLSREKEREVELSAQKMNTAMRESFLAYGIDPNYIEHALAYVNYKGLVYDEEGSFKMNVNQISYDLQDGAKLWAKQDDARLYLTPKNASGSGHQGNVSAGQNAQFKDPSANKNADFMEMLKALPGAMNS